MAHRYYLGIAHLVPGCGFVASFPDVPGFEVVASSVDEVQDKAEAELTPFLRTLADDGRTIPRSNIPAHVMPKMPVGEFRLLVRGDVPDEKPLQLIRENARRLANDAHQIFKLGSMATCVGLAIAAIEEAGKFIIYREGRPFLQNKGKLDHDKKQAVLGEHLDRLFLFEALTKMVAEFEEHLRKEGKGEDLRDFLAMSEKDRRALVYESVKEDRGLLARLVREAADPEDVGIDYSLDVKRQKVSGKREQAFYVDIDKNGRLQPTPFDITFDEACIWLERADFAIHLIDDVAEEL